MKIRRFQSRRGVLLLVILGLLAMFAMVAVAFVVLTRQARTTARVASGVDRASDPPEQALKQALNVILRGTVAPPTTSSMAQSAIVSHSLLEKIYGNESLGTIAHPATMTLPKVPSSPPAWSPAICGGQLIEIVLPSLNPDPSAPFTVRPEHYVGCVLTMLDGPAAGQSVRVVGLDPPSDPFGSVTVSAPPSSSFPNLQIVAFDGTSVSGGQVYVNGQLLAGSHYIINGVPYGGYGFGYNYNALTRQSTGVLDLTDSSSGFKLPVALLPRHPANWNPPGGANSDYTAADHQDPLLAFQVPIPVSGPAASQNTSAVVIYTPLPSLHRPELIAYMTRAIQGSSASFDPTILNQPGNLWTQWKNQLPLLRQIMFRPNPIDNPNFTGSNPSCVTATDFNPTWDGFVGEQDSSGAPVVGPNGLPFSWDVDNDGDGIPDSVWVDLGMPVRWTTDGKPYKPLFAILCLDLDGRLNVNAHGNMTQAGLNSQLPPNSVYSTTNDVDGTYVYSANPTSEIPSLSAGTPPAFAMSSSANFAPLSAAQLPRGQGYGPPDVNLMPLFLSPGASAAAQQIPYQQLLTGIPATSTNSLSPPGLNGRYGEVGVSPMPGVANTLWPLTFNKWWDFCGNYWAFGAATNWFDGYNSPPDIQSAGAIGVDAAGRPLNMLMGGGLNTFANPSLRNTPYDVNLSRNAPHAVNYAPADDPFGPAELESILRPFDRDAPELPTRLAALTSTTGNPSTSLLIPKRYAVTTESYAVPSPSLALTGTLRVSATANNSLLGENNPSGTHHNDRPQHIVDLLYVLGVPSTSWSGLIAPEMIAGQKLNLNRPLTNWPGSVQPSGQPSPGFMQFSKPASVPDWQATATFNLNPTGNQNPTNSASMDWIVARQMQARYLYILGMLLWDVALPQTNLQSANGGYLQTFTESTLSSTQKQQLTQRRIAQWAINVVCFSTADSAMVPFKYDLAPFPVATPTNPNPTPGWHLKDFKIDPTATSDAPGTYGVVWGCKPPEVIVTETAAWHNRRVADTARDPSTKKRSDTRTQGAQTVPADNDLDQVRVPQGSAFFELYCPRSATRGAAPQDLYYFDSANKQWKLDLGLLATGSPGQPGTYKQTSSDRCVYPVWRMVITSSYNNGRYTANYDVSARLFSKPDSTSLEPVQIQSPTGPFSQTPPGAFSLLSNSPAGGDSPASTDVNIPIERIVWFTSQSPVSGVNATKCQDADRIYYNQLATPVGLAGSHYAVVGPRKTTYVSSLAGQPLGTPAQQVLICDTTVGFKFASATDQNYPRSSPPATAAINPVLSIIVAGGGTGTNWPSGWSAAALAGTNGKGIGLSISEPLFSDASYYPAPTSSAVGPDGVADWYDDPNGGTNTFLAHPLEPALARLGPLPTQVPDDGKNSQRPIVKDDLVATGTYSGAFKFGYKTVFLQRLANPSLPFDPVSNPYRTVDWMPIDLTVYNGEDRKPSWPPKTPSGVNWGAWDPDDPNYDPAAAPTLVFAARQRGKTSNPLSRYKGPSSADSHYGQLGQTQYNIWAQTTDLPSSILAAKFGRDTSANFNFDLVNTLGYINAAFQDPKKGWIDSSSYPGQIGDPWQPFPWITWNGRPYVSELELLQVPATHPGRLLWEFNTANLTNAVSPYSPGVTTNPRIPAQTFPHLLDFFQSDGGLPQVAPNVHRILEFVGVPTRFSNADVLIDPNYASKDLGKHWFQPPFNRIPSFREPGRVNLNMIASFEVFQGLMDYYPGLSNQPFYDKFVRSRRGAGSLVTGGLASLNVTQIKNLVVPNNDTTLWGTAPTRFARPFRSPTAAAMITAATIPTLALPFGGREAEAGLLRSDPDAIGRPLFEFDATTFQNAKFTSSSQMLPIVDYNRNSFFGYQSIQRLGNLTTNRSNVFAIWITVGYFAVLPNHVTGGQPDAGHPDGYEVGQELGSDTGDVVRHRAFYIFDRSIPVGFQRGQDINQDKALLLKRFIE